MRRSPRWRPFLPLVVSMAQACAGRTSPDEASIRAGLSTIGASETPAQTNVDIGYDTEVGLELFSDVEGVISAVRYYKGSADTGPHTGHVWSKSGALLATVQFVGETASGWQRMSFAPPVPVTAGTHVVVSVHTRTGFAYTPGRYQGPVDAPPLHVPASGGVYAFGPDPIFPSSTYASSSYWVDVDFTQTGSQQFFTGTVVPAAQSSGSFELGLRFASDVPGALHKLRFYKPAGASGAHVGHVWDDAGQLVATAPFNDESPSGWQETPLSLPVQAGRTYVASYSTSGLFSYDLGYFAAPVDRPPLHAPAGAGVYGGINTYPTQTYQNSSYAVDVELDAGACAPACTVCGAPDGCGGTCCYGGPSSIWSRDDHPFDPPYLGSSPYELGTRFIPAIDGYVTALRTFKAAPVGAAPSGRLWDAAGNLLTIVAYQPGTTSGWQEAPLPSPILVHAGQSYVVSYTSTNGFADTPGGYSGGRNALPLVVPANGGVYAAPGAFPSQSYSGYNYWADLVFTPKPVASTLFPASAVPSSQYTGTDPFELGVRFVSHVAGSVTRLRYYRGPGDTVAHEGHLWANGNLVATTTFPASATVGWQEAPLPFPIGLAVGFSYTSSYTTSGGFAWNPGFFASAYTAGEPLFADVAAGVYAAGSGYPTGVYNGSNYWADVVFERASPSCAPVCAGRPCGADDTCGGTCCSGSGCMPAQHCDATCQKVEGCGDTCLPVTAPTCPRALAPARPLGVNLPFLLTYYFTDAWCDADEARRQLQAAGQHGVTYARFAASLNWPDEMTTGAGYLANPAEFFKRFDQLVADARAAGVHLVPTLVGPNLYLWGDVVTPQLPRSALFIPGSASRQLMERYVTDLVTRYRDDDTILFWEIGSELNLEADNFAVWSCNSFDEPGCYSACFHGAPCHRDQNDNYYTCNACRGISSSQEDLGDFNRDVAALVHRLDPTRKVSSGIATVRTNAWHLARRPEFESKGLQSMADTPEQYQESLVQLHPDGVDLVSAHLYFSQDSARFGLTDTSGADLALLTQAIAHANGKEVFVGEYGQANVGPDLCGASPQMQVCGGTDPTKRSAHRMIDTIVAKGIAYGAYFAYEFAPLNPSCPLDLSCGTTADDPLMQYLYSRNLEYGTCIGRADGQDCPGGSCAGGVCVPPVTPEETPVLLASWHFDQGATSAGWRSTGTSTAGSFAVDGYARVRSQGVAPGAYYAVDSGPVNLQPGAGVIVVSFHARSSIDTSQISLHQLGPSGDNLQFAAIPVGDAFGQNGVSMSLRPEATQVSVELRLNDGNAALDVQWVEIKQVAPADPSLDFWSSPTNPTPYTIIF